jgi:hypothetical protein
VITLVTPDGQIDPAFHQADLGFTSLEIACAFGIQHDGKIIIGGNRNFQGFLFRLNPDGSLDDSFKPPSIDAVQILTLRVLQDDRIVIASESQVSGKPPFPSLAILSPNGELQPNYPNLFEVNSINELPDGSILLGEYFGLSRLLPNGTLDTNFVCKISGSPSYAIYATLVDKDGNIWIGGAFSSVNKLPRSCLAKLFGSEQVPKPFLKWPKRTVDGLEVQLPTLAGHTYELQAASAIGDETWVTVTSASGDGNWQTMIDKSPDPQKFYRVRAR